MVDIWNIVQGKENIKPIMGTIYRVVESQEQVATLSLVNNVFEQGILEELLETTKSPSLEDTESLHYLLKTPFRYPPLKYGSRFGTSFERSLFYGSLTITTALIETAYYRFVYMLGSETPFSGTICNEYSSFTVKIRSNQGLFLDQEPFYNFDDLLTSPNSYQVSQQLGNNMRHAGIEAFQYYSARDKNKGKNIGLFSPTAFHSKKPSQLTTWFCQANVDEIGFISPEKPTRFVFFQKDFWSQGIFPAPAT